ncbi:TD and POZ domain-containing protein 3 [Araneus ventricosus]|uniref:TD and POZ domain-containing protein 3 n=1 Tax=Araneus ventricosus TaxID=182803 RepID=A0A4Y2DNV0_ARAVE|nr:TD and POZ domain-containing protein 3 [Araneus ventricosus]
MENESEYLPNDILTLQCICCFSSGIIRRAIEGVSSDYAIFDNNSINLCADKADILPKFQKVLNGELKSLLMDGIHSDIKLRARSKSYPAHKCILSARSPVFKAMFSNEMIENIKDCVDIEDLNDDTVFRLLQYIYSAEVEELEWDDATDLYEAADKYQILTLKDICSSYFKIHLCRNNACAALLLADLHHDEHLKSFVQDFILRHAKDIMNSEEWKELMKINLKLAAETMYLQYKE